MIDAQPALAADYLDGGGSSFAFGGVFVLFVVIFLLILVAGVATTIWRISAARRMARNAGLDEADAAAMTMLTPMGLDAAYLAANLRRAPQQAPAGDAASRLRELDRLRDQGLITAEEHAARRKAIIDSV